MMDRLVTLPCRTSSLCLSALSSLILACGAPGLTLTVELRTDFVPGVELHVVETRVEDAAEQRESAALRSDDFVTSARRVAEIAGLRPSRARRVTVRLLDASRAEIASRTIVVDHSTSTSVLVLITRSCRNVTCPSGQSCYAGRCQLDNCDRDACQAECSGPADCSFASCAAATCVAGACLAEPIAGACSAGLYCDPQLGCRPDPTGPRDAGAPTPDAGPPAPAFTTWALPPGASAWSQVATIGDRPAEPVRAAFTSGAEVIAVTDTSVHVLRVSDLRWLERFDRNSIFPELAGVAIGDATDTPGIRGVFFYAYEGAWNYEWDGTLRSAVLNGFTARADFGADWQDPQAAPYWTIHGVFTDPDNADGWVTVDPSSECPGRTRVGRYAAFVSWDGFGPAAMKVSIYDIDCPFRFVDQRNYSELTPFALPGAPAPFTIEAITRANGLLVFTVP